MTDTARDVIARALFACDDIGPNPQVEWDGQFPVVRSRYTEKADASITALHAAGYRILAPGELDNESLEAAAKVCEQYEGKPCGPAELWTEEQRQFFDAGQTDASLSTAAAIREMKEAGK